MRFFAVLLFASLPLAFAGTLPPVSGGSSSDPLPAIPAKEALNYTLEWRLVHAGSARLNWNGLDSAGRGWQAHLALDSVGLVSKLFRVNNSYTAVFDGGMCIQKSLLDISEGSRKREVTVTYDEHRKKVHYVERNLVANQSTDNHEIDAQACEHDVIGALYQLRTMKVDLGHSVGIPVSDGKKSIIARVEAQDRESVKTAFGNYKTIRYEAFLFDGVLYRRSGRLFVWLTDDERRLPVQIRIRLPFYIGTVTLQLDNTGVH